jgi:hypothetical protein
MLSNVMVHANPNQVIMQDRQTPDDNNNSDTNSSDGIGSSLSASPASSASASASSSANNSRVSSPTSNQVTNSTPAYSTSNNSYYYNYYQQQQPQQHYQQYYNAKYNNAPYGQQFPIVRTSAAAAYYNNYNRSTMNQFDDSNYFSSRNNSLNQTHDESATFNESYKCVKSVPVHPKPAAAAVKPLKFSIDSILGIVKPEAQQIESVLPSEDIYSSSTEEVSTKKGRKRKSPANGEMANAKSLSSVGDSKRMRTIFTQEQLDKLEVEFLRQQYMVGSERSYLANKLNLTEAQVKIWFQNRRIKHRKTENFRGSGATSAVSCGQSNADNESLNQSYSNESIDDC